MILCTAFFFKIFVCGSYLFLWYPDSCWFTRKAQGYSSLTSTPSWTQQEGIVLQYIYNICIYVYNEYIYIYIQRERYTRYITSIHNHNVGHSDIMHRFILTTRHRYNTETSSQPKPFWVKAEAIFSLKSSRFKDHSNIAVHSRLVGHSSSSLSHAVQSHRSTVVTCSHCVSICVDAISTLERTLWISMTSFTLDYTQTPRVISEAQELSPQSFSTCWKISWWLRLLTSSLFANSFLRSSCSLMCSSCTGFSGWLCFRCFFLQICSFHRFYHITPANRVFTSKACTWVDKVAG